MSESDHADTEYDFSMLGDPRPSNPGLVDRMLDSSALSSIISIPAIYALNSLVGLELDLSGYTNAPFTGAGMGAVVGIAVHYLSNYSDNKNQDKSVSL